MTPSSLVALLTTLFAAQLTCSPSVAGDLVPDQRWSFLERDAVPWKDGVTREALEIAFMNPDQPYRKGTRVTILDKKLYTETQRFTGRSTGRLDFFLVALNAVIQRAPDIPDIEMVINIMDIPGDLSTGSAPVFAQSRLANRPAHQRQWLMPDFDTFRSTGGGSVEGVMASDQARAEWSGRTGAVFWRGKVRFIAGTPSPRDITTMHIPDEISRDVFTKSDDRFTFKGGAGNWRRMTMVRTCDNKNHKVDAFGRGFGAREYSKAKKRGPHASKDKPATGFKTRAALDKYLNEMLQKRMPDDAFSVFILQPNDEVTHADMCSYQALAYLDGTSTRLVIMQDPRSE